jgi:DNA-binding MarR family transcriptional regulator
MGAQDEYLRNFCILLTDKGVVPLTDPLQISVYQSLVGGMKRPSDLTTELGLSSSSLHFVIDKMSETGIIDRTKPESDKKTVYYSTNAIVLANSTETNDRLKNISEKTFIDPLKNYKGLSSLANMLDCYTSEIGVNIDPLRMKYAEALADAMEIEKTGFEDAIMNARDIFAKITGYNFTLFSSSPLTLVLTGDEGIKDKVPTLMRFVCRLIENATGRCHKLTNVEDFNGSETMVKVTMERCEKIEEPYINTTLHHRDTERFLMVDVDGTAGLMTSDVQIDIIDSIYERPLCITDIVNKVDAPRSTITSNLLRMVEEGVISVFYSESGSAYYGLACSILLKKSRPISSDNEELRNVLDSVKDKDGAFMEGQLLYTLAYLKKLGFDSEYLMVVLGAKYMRATGDIGVQGNFDTYFGNMSDIAKAIGLSLNIVSIYPLTIGITSTDPNSEMLPSMTFIKGMAHQGLEMASSGIFVRSTDEKPEGENISFKEIYPALSMTPVKGVMVENLSPTPTTKKRTSSVKTALLNRSKKQSEKPIRTVRYITAAVFMVMLVGVIIFGFAGNTTDAQTFDLSIDDGIVATVYDADGVELTSPFVFESGVTVSLVLDEAQDIGYVDSGIAYLLEPTDGRTYSLTMNSDLFIEPLIDLSYLENPYYSFSLYCSDKAIVNDTGIILTDSNRYKELSSGLYVTPNNQIKFFANDGYSLMNMNDSESDKIFLDYTCDSTTCGLVKVREMPMETKKIIIDDGRAYYYGDQKVTKEIIIDGNVTSVTLKPVDDRNADILINGKPVEQDSDGGFVVYVLPGGEMHLDSKDRGFI